MTLKVLNPGLFSTIQDLGRIGYQSYGFSTAGALDYRSHMLANHLLDNNLSDSTIEMTLRGGTYLVQGDTMIATAGAKMEFKINGEKRRIGRAYQAAKGDVLEFGYAVEGSRTYLAVNGGFWVSEVLGSHATHTRSGIGGFKGRPLKQHDILENTNVTKQRKMKRTQLSSFSDQTVLRVIPGYQYEQFTDKAKDNLINEDYKLTKDSDRMGFRLSGPRLDTISGDHDIISEPMQLGSIQVPKNGQPIILLNDRQTAGGYTRIGTIAQVDLPKLVQLKPGANIRFETIDVKEATRLYQSDIEKILNDGYYEDDTNYVSFRRHISQRIDQLMKK